MKTTAATQTVTASQPGSDLEVTGTIVGREGDLVLIEWSRNGRTYVGRFHESRVR